MVCDHPLGRDTEIGIAQLSCCTRVCAILLTVKTNVTLKVDATLLREAKVLAAQRDSSVSRLLADELERLVRGEKSYEAARRRALSRLNKGFDLDWSPPADRAELHER